MPRHASICFGWKTGVREGALGSGKGWVGGGLVFRQLLVALGSVFVLPIVFVLSPCVISFLSQFIFCDILSAVHWQALVS